MLDINSTHLVGMYYLFSHYVYRLLMAAESRPNIGTNMITFPIWQAELVAYLGNEPQQLAGIYSYLACSLPTNEPLST